MFDYFVKMISSILFRYHSDKPIRRKSTSSKQLLFISVLELITTIMTLSELEEEARKRKERLTQWKLKKQDQVIKRKEYEEDDEDENSNKQDDSTEKTIEFPKPIFRNYKPSDSGQLSGAIVLPKPKLIDVKTLVKSFELSFLDRFFSSQIDDPMKPRSGTNENSVSAVTEEVDLLSLAPRKPDWDLKRDAEKKLKRLEKRTTRAIAELTRERLVAGQKQSQTSLAEVVATTSNLNEDDDD